MTGHDNAPRAVVAASPTQRVGEPFSERKVGATGPDRSLDALISWDGRNLVKDGKKASQKDFICFNREGREARLRQPPVGTSRPSTEETNGNT